MNTVAANAIARSISHNEIVTIDYDSDAADALLAECSGRNDGNDVTEYYGLDADGDEWRVHMRDEARIVVGCRVEGGEEGTEDYDTGKVIEIKTNGLVVVAWDSQVQTVCDPDSLTIID